MATIKSIAIIGAGGNVGQQILPILLKASFDITVITRSDSESVFPAEVHVKRTEYSLEHLTNALRGQDAAICLIPFKSIQAEQNVVEAAAAAGVKWFVPSEFGHNSTDERVLSLVPIFGGKATIIDQLRNKEVGGMSWTGIVNGLFFDFGLKMGMFGFDLKNHTANIWDDGTTPFNTTNIPTIGHALVTLFSDPSAREVAKNKHIFISSFTTSQNELLAEVEEATGTKFKVTKVSSEEMKQEYTAKLAQGDFTAAGVLLQYVAWGSAGLSQWSVEEGNKLLLNNHKDSLRETVRIVVAALVTKASPSRA